jgi:hypothetical protein
VTRRLTDSTTCSMVLLVWFGLRVQPYAIRKWAYRGDIATYKDDARGRYDLDEVISYVQSRGLVARGEHDPAH